ncbi:hypothetical protein RHSIM_Rhsim03G0168600 [Rhododendron simsii]|uniref:Pectinesterase n=1 Tax=Rhododendron simsii TaxID=118357 RepID=A0A834LSW2_RHOSS|nr:hypothetical protein RHSIM_Rhsim03G0168600 [Rhododendron simsii]
MSFGLSNLQQLWRSPSIVMKVGLFQVVIIFSSILSPIHSSANWGALNWWCDKTPYPKPCKYYLGQDGNHFVSTSKNDFRNLATKLALEWSLNGLTYIKWFGLASCSERERGAWTDCLKLYESTIVQLNHTLDESMNHDDFDVQTWLSAALTNLDTCQNGFTELGVTDNVFSLKNNNVSKLISNSLAINNTTARHQITYRERFPSWVSSGDRRLLQSKRLVPDFVVAQDGLGDFVTIKEAIDASINMSYWGRFVIYVKSGIYSENIEVGLDMENIMLIGDGWRSTIVAGNRSHVGGYSTFDSATFSVAGEGFMARGITFRNTAGPQSGQAVALLSRSDRSVFYRCCFEGYQDTLCVHSQRQFYAKSHVFGTTDFIFGNAAVVFQNCIIHGRTPLNGNQIVVTAQGRTDPNQNTGFSIHRCMVLPAGDRGGPVARPFVAYLGRPWRDYARVIYMRSYLDGFVPGVGWSQWGNDTGNLGTLYYGEYGNFGPGSSTEERVKWSGYHGSWRT